jgi:hypothetical protein
MLPQIDSYRVLHTYRTMLRMIKTMPERKSKALRQELRSSFRAPIGPHENLDDRLRVAGEKISFLRIVTPKSKPGSGGRWVYKNGECIVDGDATKVEGGRVISSFSGYNLDPCKVKQHNAGLRRAGFVNNLHAKGIF